MVQANNPNDTSLNLRDNILRNHLKDGLPGQFVYEAADCRLFYEPSMISDISNMWEAAASAAWGSKACVEGGLNLGKRESKRRGTGSFKAPTHKRGVTFKAPEKNAVWKARHGEKVPM